MGKIFRNGVMYGGSSTSAGNVSYDNSSSDLQSVTVQNAITELNEKTENCLQQVDTLPIASSNEVGNIYQYTGTTTQDYTHSYIYECVSDGGDPAVYSWIVSPTFEVKEIDEVGKFEYDGQNNILGEYFNLYEDIVDPTTHEVTTHRNAATGERSHAEGYGGNTSGGSGSHAEGSLNTISQSGTFSHVEGSQNTVDGSCAHVGGFNNIGEGDNSTTVGQYNLPDSAITAKSNLTNRIDYVLPNSQYSFETDPTASDFFTITGSAGPDLHMSIANINISDCIDGLNLSLPAGEFFVSPTPDNKDYGVIVLIQGTRTPMKIIETADTLGENITINISKSDIDSTGATLLSINCYIENDTYPNITISKVTKSLFTVGNGTSNLARSNILFATSNSLTINGDLTVTGSMNTTSSTITSSNAYYGGHIRQDGECPFRYRRMLYFGNYTGDENPKIIVDNTDPQNPVPFQPGYYSLELESYAGLPRKIMKMIENSIYSPDGEFKANMRHIVSYYCALLQHNVKSRIEITSITASNTTFTQDGETYHCPLVNYVILPPWDGSSGTYTGAAILDIVFNNFQA